MAKNCAQHGPDSLNCPTGCPSVLHESPATVRDVVDQVMSHEAPGGEAAPEVEAVPSWPVISEVASDVPHCAAFLVRVPWEYVGAVRMLLASLMDGHGPV